MWVQSKHPRIVESTEEYLIEAPAVEQGHQLMEVPLRGVEDLLDLPERFLKHNNNEPQHSVTTGRPCRVLCSNRDVCDL